MKLKFLLYVLYRKLLAGGASNPVVQKLLNRPTGSVLIATKNGSCGRVFVLGSSGVFSKGGSSTKADVSLTWKDEESAFKAMTSSVPDAMPQALERGDLAIEGDLAKAAWFGSLIAALKEGGGAASVGEGRPLRVAVIGLGKMGAGLARNIQKAGFELTVYNRTEAKAQPFCQAGARLAQTPRQAAEGADVVVTSLMDDSSVLEAVEHQGGILAGLKPGAVHLCATTISPELAEHMEAIHRERGVEFVSGCVVGRPDAAAAGQLLTLMAGSSAAVKRCKSISASYSEVTLVVGERACLANYAKLAANYFAVSNLELMGQIYAFGDSVGLERAFLKNLFVSSYSNPTLKMYAGKICARAFDEGVGFELTGGLKDLRLMLAASEGSSRSLEYAPIIIGKMEQAISAGRERMDWSVFTAFTPNMGTTRESSVTS